MRAPHHQTRRSTRRRKTPNQLTYSKPGDNTFQVPLSDLLDLLDAFMVDERFFSLVRHRKERQDIRDQAVTNPPFCNHGTWNRAEARGYTALDVVASLSLWKDGFRVTIQYHLDFGSIPDHRLNYFDGCILLGEYQVLRRSCGLGDP